MQRITMTTGRTLAWTVATMLCAYALPTTYAQDGSQDDTYSEDSYSQQYDSQRSRERAERGDRAERDDRRERPRFRERDDRQPRQERRSERADSDRSNDRASDDREFDYRRDDRGPEEQQYDAQHRDQPAGLGVSAATSRRGVRVLRVMENSPADEAGLQENDEILAVNGTTIEDGRQLTQVIRRQEPGAQVRLRIYRDGQERTLTATLEPLREAIGNQGDRPDERSRRFYRGNPPWGDDQLMQHVDHLERHIQDLRRELQDLRQMLTNDPGRRGYDQQRDYRRFNDRGERFRDDDRSEPDNDRFYENREDSRRSR